MGLYSGGRSCRTADTCSPSYAKAVQPNPGEFRFRKIQEYPESGVIVAEVVYPNCTNFEGHKIIVFKGLTKKDLVEQRILDPHFSREGLGIHIVARFVPTGAGWDLANKFAKSL